MRYKYLIIAIAAISLIAFTLISTAAATDYYAKMTGIKSGKEFTFTIDTSTASDAVGNKILSFGGLVKTDSLIITVYDSKGAPVVIPVDWTHVSVSPDCNSVLVELVKQDGIPSHASAVNAQGTLTTGDTFLASGPGWTWGNTR
jgi:hypothetical protein